MAKIVLGTDMSTATKASYLFKMMAAPLCVQFSKSEDGMVMPPEELIDLDNSTDIGEYIFYNTYHSLASLTGTLQWNSLTKLTGKCACFGMFEDCLNLEGVEFDGLEYIEGDQVCSFMFRNCTGLKTVRFKNLQRIISTSSGNGATEQMLFGCTALTTLDLSNLVSLTGPRATYGLVEGCSNLETVNLGKLTTISGGNYIMGNFFSDCSKLKTVNFTSLSSIPATYVLQYAFANCTSLTDVYFPALTSSSFGSYRDQFSGMLYGCNGVKLHFASNAGMQSKLSLLTGYPNFGGTNTTILYDL